MLKQIILNSRGGLKPKYHCNLTLITDWNIRKEHSIALYFYHSRPSLSFTWFAAPWKTFKFSIWRKNKILCLSCVVFDFIHVFFCYYKKDLEIVSDFVSTINETIL